ncbi:hypothetical protein KGM_201976 [Danaus plexippus plexippus]|uniref:Uncharacterized protein n=1 Tax=Danaus plexippus plexippus TaxID=278856 RepID=A0A212EL43_DANPL|nr:hypothetical protein KGM_201976 [Danaus plexippus plexippus]
MTSKVLIVSCLLAFVVVSAHANFLDPFFDNFSFLRRYVPDFFDQGYGRTPFSLNVNPSNNANARSVANPETLQSAKSGHV